MGKLYDDVVAKLPIVLMYGDESEWDEEEKERCLGDDEAFGFDLDEELAKVSQSVDDPPQGVTTCTDLLKVRVSAS